MSLLLESLKKSKTVIRISMNESNDLSRDQELLPIAMENDKLPKDSSILYNIINNKKFYSNNEVLEFKNSILNKDNKIVLSQEELIPLLYNASNNPFKNNVLMTFIDNIPRDIQDVYIKAISTTVDHELMEASTTFIYCLASLKNRVDNMEILQELLYENLVLYRELGAIIGLIKKIHLVRSDALNDIIINSIVKGFNADIDEDGDDMLKDSQEDDLISSLNKKLLVTAAILGVSFIMPQISMLSLGTISLISKYIDTGE